MLKKESPRDPRSLSIDSKLNKPNKGRAQRVAKLEIRFGKINILKPRSNNEEISSIAENLWVDDVRENSKIIKSCQRTHWRLITSYPVNSIEEAWKIVKFYQKRWMIEQCFRAAKRDGIKLEEIESTKGKYIGKMVFIGLVATIKILQLTYCRDHNIFRPASTIFSNEEIFVLNKLNKEYQGKTIAQKNPFKKIQFLGLIGL